MNWGRPLVVIEIPGTTPYGLMMHLHSRSLNNPDHGGFFDLMLNARGLKDTGFGPLEIAQTDMITCQIPTKEEGKVSLNEITGPAAHMYAQRAKAADEFMGDGKTALIRHYAEYANDPYLEKMQKAFELVFLRKARLLFVEKKIDPLFSFIRYAISSQRDDGPFEITKEQVDWYKRCYAIYQGHKQYWSKNNPGKMAVVDIESIMRSKAQIKWGDGVTATVDLRTDMQARPLMWNDVNYRPVANFKDVDTWFKPQQKPLLSQEAQQLGRTSG
jgi:hypothetical protein